MTFFGPFWSFPVQIFNIKKNRFCKGAFNFFQQCLDILNFFSCVFLAIFFGAHIPLDSFLCHYDSKLILNELGSSTVWRRRGLVMDRTIPQAGHVVVKNVSKFYYCFVLYLVRGWLGKQIIILLRFVFTRVRRPAALIACQEDFKIRVIDRKGAKKHKGGVGKPSKKLIQNNRAIPLI